MRNTQRLDKILGNFGYGTRKEIKQMAKEGLISVDGKIVKDSSLHVDPKASKIIVDDEELQYKEFIYIMMNKPAGVISATFDQRHKTVLDLVPEEYSCFELFPVGRLDIDTEGLLVLTNDGVTAHELLSPKKHVSKRYYADIEGVVNAVDIEAFHDGVTLEDGYKTLPAKLIILESGETSRIEVEIVEGKFHQIKRMFQAVGKEVVFLKRLSMGGLTLDKNIGLGNCREMTEEEIQALKNVEVK